MDGAEIAEIYVADQESTIFRPKKELRAFKKVFLKAGEEKEVSVTLSKRAFAFYNVELQDWQVETGLFDIMVGASSRDIRLTKAVNIISDLTGCGPLQKDGTGLLHRRPGGNGRCPVDRCVRQGVACP